MRMFRSRHVRRPDRDPRRPRSRFTAALLGVALAGAGAVAPAAVTAAAGPRPAQVVGPTVDITVLSFNDFHGRIQRSETGAADTVKFAATIEELRDAAPGGTLLVTGGDNVGASLFASAIQQDQPAIDVLNALEVDANAVGNHEFDQGFDDLVDRVAVETDSVILGANVRNADGSPALPEYEIFTVDGVRIGVIGAVTDETPTLVRPGGIVGLVFEEPVEAVNRVADQLLDDDLADVLIATFHEGAAVSTSIEDAIAAVPGGAFDRMVNDLSEDIALIINGHTNQLHAWDGPGPRPIMQSNNYGSHVGETVLTIDLGNDFAVVGYTAENHEVDADLDVEAAIATYPRVAAVADIVDDALAYAAVIGEQEVGSVTADITTAYLDGSYVDGVYVGPDPDDIEAGRDARESESTLGNLVGDALVHILSGVEGGPVDIGVVNPGGLRDELFYGDDGVITYADANAVLPFGNELWSTTLTGDQFKEVLEQQWQPDGVSRPYLHLGLSENVSYTFDSEAPRGERITSIMIDGEPYDPAAEYRIGSFSFLIEGGDNFTVFAEGSDPVNSGLVDRDGWIEDFIANESPLSPSFARRGVEVAPLPTAVAAGSSLTFDVAGLNLTSLGSPENTTLAISVGGTDVGTVDVTDGAASVDVTVPAGVAGGEHFLTLVAEPSGTTVEIPVTVSAGAVVPLSPERVLDTRSDDSPVTGFQPAGSVLTVPVAGLAGVPADAEAVALNLTIANADGEGWATVWPCDAPQPYASHGNFVADDAAPNTLITALSADGEVCIYVAESGAHVIADVGGYVPAGGGYESINPARLADSRPGLETIDGEEIGEGRVGAGEVWEIPVAGRGGVPEGAEAAMLNITVGDAEGEGYVTVWPCDGDAPYTSTSNFRPGLVTPNGYLGPLSADGSVCVLVEEAATQVIVDVYGHVADGEDFGALTPARLADTRPGLESVDGEFVGNGLVGEGEVFEVQVAGRGGVPEGASGAVLNVTAGGADGAGYVTMWPCGDEVPYTSISNFIADAVTPNLAIAALSEDGTVCFTAGQTPVHIIVDVTGSL